MNNERNQMLDCVKCVACFCVVCSHVLFPGLFGKVFSRATHFHVPCFAMISGYYAQKCYSNQYLVKHILKLLKITLISMLIYFLWAARIYVAIGDGIEYMGGVISTDNIIKMLFWNDFDYIYAGHLWFLPALLYAYLICILFNKIQRKGITYSLILALILTKIILRIYDTGSFSYHFYDNWILGVVPWFILGSLIYGKDICVKNTYLLLGILAGIVWTSVFTIFNKIDLSEIGIVVASMSIFIFAVNNPSCSFGDFAEKIGRDYSLYIYILHVLIAGIFDAFISNHSVLYTRVYQWIRPILVFGVSLLAGYIMSNIKKIRSKR